MSVEDANRVANISSLSNAVVNAACLVEGQADIYGVGIRVSLYVQWFSTVLAYIYEPKGAATSTIANYFFSIAVAICALVHRTEIHSQEVILVATLLLLPPTVIVVSLLDGLATLIRPKSSKTAPGVMVDPKDPNNVLLPPRKPYTATKMFRDVAIIIATAFLLAVAVWELFDGVGKAAAVVEGCPQPQFIYSYYLSGKYERLLKVVSVIFVVFTPLGLIFRMCLRVVMQNQAQLQSNILIRTHSFASESAHSRSSRGVVGHFIKVRTIVAFAWGIVAAYVVAQNETIIKQNTIQGLQDPSNAGQLIPLIIGGCQFCVITHQYWIDPKHRKNQGVPATPHVSPPATMVSP